MNKADRIERRKRRREKLRQWFSREHIKQVLKKCVQLILNPRLLLCLLIAWMITNGWSYIFFALGMALEINWMMAAGAAYMSFLWIPFTPEKLLTVMIAMLLMRLIFPRDEKTLGVLRSWREKLRSRKRKRLSAPN